MRRKRLLSWLLCAALLLGFVPLSALPAKAAGTDVTQYSYEITPILSPFCYYLYVKTDNPDPASFRLVDRDSDLYGEDSHSRISQAISGSISTFQELDPGTYYVCRYNFPDVVYEDAALWRVKGGYIFTTENAYSDGGSFVLQQLTAKGDNELGDRFSDTGVTVSCPPMTDDIGYLLDTCTDPDQGFFENLDAVQAFLNENAVYPRSVYDLDRPSKSRPYPLLASSPYQELTYNEHYEMYEAFSSGLFASRAYPFVLDSLGVPGTIAMVAMALAPDCEITSGSVHSQYTIRYGGESKTYGGAGSGGYDPLYSNRVQKDFTFTGTADDLGLSGTLQGFRDRLLSYSAPAREDAETYRDLISGTTFIETIRQTGGTWIRIAVEGFGFGTSFGYVVPYLSGFRIASDTWVDGRYIDKYEEVTIGTRFSDRPNANIVVRNMTYTDINGVEHTQDVLFTYSASTDTWSAAAYYTNSGWIYGNQQIPEEFTLTRAQAEALEPDRETNHLPAGGLIYDGTAYPGTPFTLRQVTGIQMPETMTLYVGAQKLLTPVIQPEDPYYPRLRWSCSDPEVLRLGEGDTTAWLTALTPGEAVVTAKTIDGAYIATCTVTVLPNPCGEEHQWDEGTVLTAPTCGDQGTMLYTCTVCGVQKRESIPYTGEHIWGESVLIQEPTCGNYGYTRAICTVCGWSHFEYISPTEEHQWDEGAVTREPTCSAAGRMQFTCAVCGQTETRPIEMLEHSFGDWTTTRTPTCTVDGRQTRTCSVCGGTESQAIPALGHDDTTAVTPPTCTEEGYTTFTCARCGEQRWDDWVPALGHDFDIVETAPTCIEIGYTTSTCARCGVSYMDDVVRPLGHDYVETVTEPTCTALGYTTFTCARCGESYEGNWVQFLGHDYEGVKTAPTCTEIGYTTYTCTRCGDSYVGDRIAALDHSWDEGAVTKEPTEEEEGERTFTCSRCGETKTARIPRLNHVHRYEAAVTVPTCTEMGYTTYTCACGDSYVGDRVASLGHSYGGWTAAKEATCTEKGEETRACVRCGVVVARETAALGHSFGSWTTAKEATCTEKGEETRACVRCDAVETRETAALSHDYVATLTPPDCTENGYYKFTCSRCGHSFMGDRIPALGHDWDDGVVTKEPTEEDEGEYTFTCLRCEETWTERIPPLSHVHKYEAAVTAPTCTEEGYTTYTCSCGSSYRDDRVPALGHDFEEAVTAPTCVEPGYTIFTCKRCGGSYADDGIPPLGHDFEEIVTAPTCTEAGYTTVTCTRCGEGFVGSQVPASGHSWSEGAVTKEPTEEEEGERTFTCSQCGEMKTERIPPLNHVHRYEAAVTAPTCTEMGYTTYTCACGNSYVSGRVAALGHSFGEWVESKAATCTETGEEARVCARCGVAEAHEIAALGHAFRDGVCTRCGEADPNHVPGKPANPFVDVKEGAYYYDPVLWAVNHTPQITNGTDLTHFSPDRICTRAQVVTFLWRAMGQPEPEKTDNPFTDVKPDAYYFKAVAWAVEKGITNGTGPTTFSPDRECTRAQVVTFLWRTENEPEPASAANPFGDVAANQYYTKAVAWAVGKDITTGTAPDRFSPDSTCTRGQIVTFLYRDMK